MRIFHGLNKFKKFRRPVVALGVFDGVHRGHMNILKAASNRAKSINGTSVALTFDPHPQEKERLYSLQHRLRLIEKLGIDVCIVINFGRKFAGIRGEDFVKNVLIKKIGAKQVFVGRNFRFGKHAACGLKALREFSHTYHFKLNYFKVIKIGDRPVSSTCIRAMIKKGDLHGAQKLLGRPVSILGTVIRGASVARRLGFPTANINPHHEVTPAHGIYAVRIIFRGKKMQGVCYIGSKPTFKKSAERHIEVHIFNFHKNIYGEYLELQFVKKIRGDRKFATRQVLARQIKKDIQYAQAFFSRH